MMSPTYSFQFTVSFENRLIAKGRWSGQLGRTAHKVPSLAVLPFTSLTGILAGITNWFGLPARWLGTIVRNIRQDTPDDFADLLHFTPFAGSSGLVAAVYGQHSSEKEKSCPTRDGSNLT